jgi:hypothetical protein
MRNIRRKITGKITSGIALGTLALRTIDFVYEQLPSWRDDPNRPREQSENKLNLHLCKFLDVKARNEFPSIRFDHEEYQFGSRTVDISVSPTIEVIIGARLYYTIYDPVIVFECKRLPAPLPEREKEYVTGGTEHKKGGIQRFKLGLHGANHDIAAMIGYLQEGCASDWHDKINAWIVELTSGSIADGCVWNRSEMLGKLEEDSLRGIANCQSTHDRISNAKSNRILIRHLWIKMYM